MIIASGITALGTQIRLVPFWKKNRRSFFSFFILFSIPPPLPLPPPANNMKAAVFLCLIACVLATAFAAPLTEKSYQFLFTKFTQQYEKSYEMNDVFSRYQTFKSNLDLIMAHNAQSNQTFSMGVNQFADFSATEFNTLMGLRNVKGQAIAQPAPCPFAAKNATAGNYVDWVAKNVLTPVKDQAQCGSCWAFSANGCTEARFSIKNNLSGSQVPDLAEQQLVDCVNSSFDPSFISEGCNGGLMSEAHKYTSKVGVCATADYPYTARNGACKSNSCKSAIPLGGVQSKSTGEAELIQNLQSGPVSIGIAASSSAFQFYSNGIVTTCTDRSLNHGVVATGYGFDIDTGLEFFDIRNSWGSRWGNKGHLKVATIAAKGYAQCGVATSPWDSIINF